MAQRRRIGIIYTYDENWIGGTYYIQNLISALNNLPESSLFELVIFTENNEHYTELKNSTHYPFLVRGSHVVRLSLIKRMVNRIGRAITNQNIFSVLISDIAWVFPGNNERLFKKDQPFLYWIPDFQENYLPEYFSPQEITRRKQIQANIIKTGKYILFSSQSARNDFNEIYPLNNLNQFVLNFAVTHPELKECFSKMDKFNIPRLFFICCNQFYKHKNHITLFKAIQLLKKEGHDICVVFTGKEHDERHPEFFKEIIEMIQVLEIENQVKLLGFINREDQLCLMKNAVAIIQPSLFEGWSTVIEDAKALRAKVIASDINVHREQLNSYGLSLLFGATNEIELAKCLLTIGKIDAVVPDYRKNVIVFAENFRMIIDNISNN